MRKMCFCLFLSLLFGSHTYGFDKRVDKQGYFNGKHWEIVTDRDKVEYSDEYVGLYVDGTPVFSCNNYTIDTVSIGKNLYFKVKKRKGNHRELYNMDGNRALSIEFDQIDPVHNLDGYYEFTLIEGKSHKNYLCDLQFNIIKSGYVNAYGVSFDEGILEKGIWVVYKRDEEYEVELYNLNWELVLPPFVLLTTESDYYGNKYKFIKDSSGYIGRLDLNLNWIIPLGKHFTDIEDEKILGKKYYKCKNGGYWGLFDTKLNEVIAPDYEELEVFDGTNFIKFKLNGFWGVMALQGNKAKTIIPTTRGYTSISRYVKSQKRFTYEMNGYKGECNHLGQQVSKIKTTSSYSTSSSSSVSLASSSYRALSADLTGFDLIGPVKSCTWGNPHDDFAKSLETVKFDQKGNIAIPGLTKIKRYAGTKQLYYFEKDPESWEIEYDRSDIFMYESLAGKASKKIKHVKYFNGLYTILMKVYYDKNGHIIKAEEYTEWDMILDATFNYRYLNFDAKGNWIKRECTRKSKRSSGTTKGIETRTITYY